MPTINQYFTNVDKKIFIDLRCRKGYTNKIEKINTDNTDPLITITLKATAAKKMRLRVTGYYQGEYLYSLSNEGVIMNGKEYGVSKPKSVAT